MKKLMLILIAASLLLSPSALAHTESDPKVVDLLAGQDMDVGDVEVWNDGEYLYVRYKTTEDWCMTEVHLHVAESEAFIPQNGSGNPQPGRFEYKEELDSCVVEWEKKIPLNDFGVDDKVTIAAHAVVKRAVEECLDFEEFAEYDSVKSVLTSKGEVGFYMTDYTDLELLDVGDFNSLEPTGRFPIIAEEQTKDPDHDYIDPEMKNIVSFTVGRTFEDDWVKSDPENTGAGGNLLTDTPDYERVPFWQHAYSNFEAITMDFTGYEGLEGIEFAGVDLDWNEVWYVLYFNSDNEVVNIETMGPPSGQTRDGEAIPISYNNPEVAKVVIWGNMNGGTPGKVGFAIDNVCMGSMEEETAWAEGYRFVDRGNWATYFTYTVQEECTNVPELINGGFETPKVLGWDIYDSDTEGLGWTVEWYSKDTSYEDHTRPEKAHLEIHESGTVVEANQGEQYVELDTDWDGPAGGLNGEPASVKIYQVLDTCPGEQYTLNYAWRGRPGHSSKVRVIFGDYSATHQDNNSQWNEVETTVTADDYTETLEFTETGPPDSFGMFLDGVSVVKCTDCNE